MGNKILSVILPVYNVEDYIEKCVDSLLAQTYRPIEIILVDDGSTDRSGEICDILAARFDSVKAFHKRNGGQATARNIGLEYMNGDFFTFVDPDDYLGDPTTYENCIKLFPSDKRIDIVQYPYQNVSSSGLVEDIMMPDKENAYVTKEEYILNSRPTYGYAKGDLTTSVCDKVFRSSVFKELRFENVFLEDGLYVLDTFKRASGIEVMKNGMYCYLTREGSTMHKTRSRKRDRDTLYSRWRYYNALNIWTKETTLVSKQFVNLVYMMAAYCSRYGMDEELKSFITGTSRVKRTSSNESLTYGLATSFINMVGLSAFVRLAAIMLRPLIKAKDRNTKREKA